MITPQSSFHYLKNSLLILLPGSLCTLARESTILIVVGVLSIQGDFRKHLDSLQRCGAPAREIRTPEDLTHVDRLIIPGGESSTVGMLLERFGLAEAIRERVQAGMPIWGTCMGMILLAEEVEQRDQFRLGLLPITVRRNAFGRQVHSFEIPVEFDGLAEPVLGVFIRAPIVTAWADSVVVKAKHIGAVVAVQSGKVLGTSFHPELTADTRLHEYFLGL